jgi:Fe-S-cluster containining protein
MSIRTRYKRTVCACPSCAEHCRHLPGCLAPGDLELITEWLNREDASDTDRVLAKDLEILFCASPGALVAREGTPFRIGTIVPAKTETGACVFLDETTGRCLIHPVAPFGCAFFDNHISVQESNHRSRAMLLEILQSPDYKQARRRMIDRGQVAQAPEDLRREYANG